MRHAILSLLTLCLCLAPLPAAGHPHVFIDVELTFVFDLQGLTGIHQRWVFDEMFSSQIVDMVDANDDGRLSEAEARNIEQEAFVNLKNFNFFSHVVVGGRKVAFSKATQFVARQNKGILSYEFLLPCSVPVQAGAKGLVRVAVYDQSYYSDVVLVDTKPKLLGTEHQVVDMQVRDAEAVYTEWGPIQPKEVLLSFAPR
ncbi:DUF1007 family protein [Desulfocurvibacter africanus]|uniref:DUF1007 family protein n=1 Tax=Desulfocurvibacter africanus TaxID=873 RepID=UPI00041C0119|nr:DUF1007 family protein [Desulfocurvibacter africanus]